MTISIGTAGWSIPRGLAERFPADGAGLERYAARFGVTEINSSFHRPHRLSTWQRWYDSVPAEFRFSVKLPKQITHVRKLVDCEGELDRFADEANGLREKLAVVLVQLPPKLDFDRPVVGNFMSGLKARTSAAVACEPRHVSWFTEDADALLGELGIARVAADPPVCGAGALPGGWPGLHYWRLHGSPSMYRSSYHDRLEGYADKLKTGDGSEPDVWCIFDNTASSAATADALELIDLLVKNPRGGADPPTGR